MQMMVYPKHRIVSATVILIVYKRVGRVSIRESVDSLCRDDADMPMPPYIRKACNRTNAAFVNLFMYLTVMYGYFST